MISFNSPSEALSLQSQSDLKTVGEISATYGLSANTVRSLANSGVLVVGRVGQNGWRRISEASVKAHLGLASANRQTKENPSDRGIVCYHRKSSGSRNDLLPGIEELRGYVKDKYGIEGVKVYADLASHLNVDGRKEFSALLDCVFSGSIRKIVILYRDRISRLPMHSMIEKICSKFHCEIEYVHKVETKDSTAECLNDLVSYLHTISCRQYSKRAADRRRINLSEEAKELIREKIEIGWGAGKICQELNAKGFVGVNGKNQEKKIQQCFVARYMRQYSKVTNKVLPQSLSSLVGDFRNEKMRDQEKSMIPQKELYLLFQRWCRDKGLVQTPTRYVLNQELRKMGIKIKKDTKTRIWSWCNVSLV